MPQIFPKNDNFGHDLSGLSVKCQQSVISIRLGLKIYVSPTANEKLKVRQIRCVSKYIKETLYMAVRTRRTSSGHFINEPWASLKNSYRMEQIVNDILSYYIQNGIVLICRPHLD